MPTKRRKITMNISMTKDTVELLTKEAERQDRSRSWIIEWAVKKALDPAQQPKPAQPHYVLPPMFGEMPVVTCGPASEQTGVQIGSPLDTEWPDALERSVPPLEFSA